MSPPCPSGASVPKSPEGLEAPPVAQGRARCRDMESQRNEPLPQLSRLHRQLSTVRTRRNRPLTVRFRTLTCGTSADLRSDIA
jgi:hypothetical protein